MCYFKIHMMSTVLSRKSWSDIVRNNITNLDSSVQSSIGCHFENREQYL